MTQAELKEAMLTKLLPAFNNEGVTLSDDTVLNTVLSETDGFGSSNSAEIFHDAIVWTIKVNNKTKKIKKFQINWLNLTVSGFAQMALPE